MTYYIFQLLVLPISSTSPSAILFVHSTLLLFWRLLAHGIIMNFSSPSKHRQPRLFITRARTEAWRASLLLYYVLLIYQLLNRGQIAI